jgi:hypothetical protein
LTSAELYLRALASSPAKKRRFSATVSATARDARNYFSGNVREYAAGNTPCAASSRPSREQYSNIHTIATAGISASWTQSSLLLDAAPPDPLLPAAAAALPLAPGIVPNTCCLHHLLSAPPSMFADLFGWGKVRKSPRCTKLAKKTFALLVKIRETHRNRILCLAGCTMASVTARNGGHATSGPLCSDRLIASLFSAGVAETVTLPIDVAKTRAQLARRVSQRKLLTPRRLAGSLLFIARNEGAPALFRGLSPALMRQGVCNPALTLVCSWVSPMRTTLGAFLTTAARHSVRYT